MPQTLVFEALKYAFLWLHLFSAILFIGGSFFMWLVLVPGSKDAIHDEAERSTFVAKISKRFARLTWMLLLTLVLTGIINAYWYLPQNRVNPFDTYLVYSMVICTAVLVVLLYGPGRYYGKRISKLAKEKDVEGLKRLRKKSTLISYTNLAIMVLITIIAVLM
ncbi:MAG: hypothetical protein M1544_01910 [Candidatus Marsarchaeota archaeon]|nr:hypothetical protein [Candidatus Marsarchaeota archaeon]MCL5102088.1 hypothetical protein [Candidatus Marsarchaeota archaeon]